VRPLAADKTQSIPPILLGQRLHFQRKEYNMTQWSLNGTYFETCNCEAACPCVFTIPPTQGHCTALVAWHIAKRKFGDVALDTLNVALAVHTPGHMLQTK
jgi:hypothetical protein